MQKCNTSSTLGSYFVNIHHCYKHFCGQIVRLSTYSPSGKPSNKWGWHHRVHHIDWWIDEYLWTIFCLWLNICFGSTFSTDRMVIDGHSNSILLDPFLESKNLGHKNSGTRPCILRFSGHPLSPQWRKSRGTWLPSWWSLALHQGACLQAVKNCSYPYEKRWKRWMKLHVLQCFAEGKVMQGACSNVFQRVENCCIICSKLKPMKTSHPNYFEVLSWMQIWTVWKIYCFQRCRAFGLPRDSVLLCKGSRHFGRREMHMSLADLGICREPQPGTCSWKPERSWTLVKKERLAKDDRMR